MNKAFPRHVSRQVEPLDELWDFRFFEKTALEAVPSAPIDFSAKIVVPGAFDAMPDYLGKRGTGVYRRTLQIEPGTEALLEFEAASMTSRVVVDGVTLKEHFCGYAPFTVKLPASNKPRRDLLVYCDNLFDAARTPMHEHYFDFYQFGGLIRPVWLHHLPTNHLLEVKVDATDYSGGRITIHGRASAAGEIGVALLDSALPPLTAKSNADGVFNVNLQIPNPHAWSPKHPHLYRVRVTFGADDQVVRFGLREIKTDGQKLVLNGEPIRLFGYNRHEYFPNFGPSTPYAQMANDVQLLKDCGCNFVRGSHYPQDQRFLDLCDELGLLVWEENLGWQQYSPHMENPRYREHHQAALEEMVERSYNHPCVIMWGFLNEGPSEAHETFHLVFDPSMAYLRARGGNRLVTYGSNRLERDAYFAKVDIVSINCYPAWYGCEDHPEPLSLIGPFIDGFIAHLDAIGLGDKPFLISEIGCEGLYGWRDQQRDFHSEDYQHDYLTTVCRHVMDTPRILGVCLWHFSDARTKSKGRALGRPRAFNNKGTFDEYRRPKLARDSVRSIFREADLT